VYREDWQAVYTNQDRILQGLKSLEDEIFLAGGTGLQRFVLPRAYRHSEDLDFFFPTHVEKSLATATGEKMVELIAKIPGASIEQSRRIKDEGAYRLWCRFDDNEEVVKVELLNFTCTRLKDTTFVPEPFRTENAYNLMLYKLKALCDRPDTIKDLFDLYFIFRQLPAVKIDALLADLNTKFEKAIGIRYEKVHLLRALEHRLKWDIEIADITHPYDLKLEIESFQNKLHDALQNNELLDFSDAYRIRQNAAKFGLDEKGYLEHIDFLGENAFWTDDIKFINRKKV
jgi:predicted nucleotidyltransferase component of viral defense system